MVEDHPVRKKGICRFVNGGRERRRRTFEEEQEEGGYESSGVLTVDQQTGVLEPQMRPGTYSSPVRHRGIHREHMGSVLLMATSNSSGYISTVTGVCISDHSPDTQSMPVDSSSIVNGSPSLYLAANWLSRFLDKHHGSKTNNT